MIHIYPISYSESESLLSPSKIEICLARFKFKF